MGSNATDYRVEVIGYPVTASINAAWEALAAHPLEANPFLSPAYLQPLAQHYARDAEWRLALVWQHSARTRLVGLVPVTLARIGRSMTRQVVPHVHRLLPLGQPLLSADLDEANRALAALMVHLGDGLVVDLANISRGGPTAKLIEGLCDAQGWVRDTMKDAPLTHGLHLPTTPALPAEASLAVLTSPGDVREGLERILSLTTNNAGPDAANFTFLRAMSRSMAQQDRLVLALLETSAGHAGAIALRHDAQGWLWRMEGPLARDPVVQAVLCDAVGKATGAAPFSLVKPRLTGLGCAPLVTQSWSIIKASHRPAGRSLMLTARRVAASVF
jgi:hypothetical protein